MYCDECSQACAFCAGTYVALRAERDRLRAGLEEMLVVEMTFQNEPDDPSVYSEGWACGHCDLGDGNADRPYAEEKAEVTHPSESCPLYRPAAEQAGNVEGKK